MHYRTTLTLATLAAVCMTASAQLLAPPIIHDIEVGSQQAQTLDPLTIQQGGSAAYRVRLKSGGRWLSLAGLTARLDIRESATSTEAIQVSGTAVTNATPHYFAFPVTSSHTGTARDGWKYSVVVLLSGGEYVLGVGDIDIPATAWTGQATEPTPVVWNWARSPGYTNTLASGPYIFSDGLTAVEGANGRVTVTATGSEETLQTVTDRGATSTNPIAVPAVTGLDYIAFPAGATPAVSTDGSAVVWGVDGDIPALWLRTGTRDFNALLDSIGGARNTTGATIPALTPIYFTGNQGGSPFPLIGVSVNTNSATMPAIGVTLTAIGNNSNGAIQLFGRVDGVDTSAFSEGDGLYVGNGVLVNERPATGKVQFMGIVLIDNATTGRVALTPEVLFDLNSDETLTGDGTADNPLSVASNIVAGAAAGATAVQAAELAAYLPLTGGTLDGDLTVRTITQNTNTLIVSGAGSPQANGTYLWDGTAYILQTEDQIVCQIELGGFLREQGDPVPLYYIALGGTFPEGPWSLEDAAGLDPVPSVSYPPATTNTVTVSDGTLIAPAITLAGTNLATTLASKYDASNPNGFLDAAEVGALIVDRPTFADVTNIVGAASDIWYDIPAADWRVNGVTPPNLSLYSGSVPGMLFANDASFVLPLIAIPGDADWIGVRTRTTWLSASTGGTASVRHRLNRLQADGTAVGGSNTLIPIVMPSSNLVTFTHSSTNSAGAGALGALQLYRSDALAGNLTLFRVQVQPIYGE